MRGYVRLSLPVIALLLLMPLLAYGQLQKKDAELPASAAVSAPPATDSEQAAPTDTFRVADPVSGAVTVWDEKQFLVGILAAEMYPTYHIEAMKAQAVAAYTYFSYERTVAREGGKDADFSDVPSTFAALMTEDGMKARFQENYTEYRKKLTEAVDAVYGQRILYDGKPIMAVYHALSAGQTETAGVVWGKDLPYLRPVASEADKLAPKYESVVTVTKDEFAKAVKNAGAVLPDDPAKWIDPSSIRRSDSGTVTAITVGAHTFTGREIRSLFSLRSSVFTVEWRENAGFVFTTHGYGHGVGMSQYGANCMANNGKNYKEILQHYYTDVTVA